MPPPPAKAAARTRTVLAQPERGTTSRSKAARTPKATASPAAAAAAALTNLDPIDEIEALDEPSDGSASVAFSTPPAASASSSPALSQSAEPAPRKHARDIVPRTEAQLSARPPSSASNSFRSHNTGGASLVSARAALSTRTAPSIPVSSSQGHAHGGSLSSRAPQSSRRRPPTSYRRLCVEARSGAVASKCRVVRLQAAAAAQTHAHAFGIALALAPRHQSPRLHCA